MATYFTQNTNNVEDIEQMNNVINKVNKVNTEATSNIGQLTDLNNKAQELSNNINQALPLNSELVRNTESAKVTNTNLAATNQEATTKNTELQASLEKTKEFINGLDGSQNIPQIRMDVTELQNGLKSNQALAYTGSSISADNTLEGRTEGMKIEGRTLVNLAAKKDFFISVDNSKATYSWSNMKNLYKAGIYTIKNITGKILVWNIHKIDNDNWVKAITVNSSSTITLEENQYIRNIQALSSNGFIIDDSIEKILSENVIILDNNQVDVIDSIKYFEGIKSFGEAEGNKISILSNGKNLFDKTKCVKGWISTDGNITGTNDDTFTSDFIPVKPNTHYTKRIREVVRYYDVNKTLILRQSEEKTFIPPSNAKYMRVVGSPYNFKEQFQIEEGTQSTPYQPYQQDKKDILIKEPLREGDYLYEDNGQVKVYRPTKQYTFTGNETSIVKWVTVTDENFIGFYITNDDIPNLTSKRSLVVCNNFPSVDRVITKRNMYIAANSVNICIEKSALTTPDIEGFRAWLKANPTTIVYQLAEPVVEIVEYCVDIDLDTFVEKTYFNILNSLPGTLDFKVPSNIGSVVQNMAKEVNNIWDVINNLLVPSLIDINKNVAMSTIKNNLK